MEPPVVYNVVTTDGITIAIVSFLFACFVFPQAIKHRQQFYAAFFVTIGILLLATLRLMLYKVAGLYVVLGVLTGLGQVVAMVLLFLSAGGMTLGQLTDELKGSYEVIRRGEEQKEVIVPLRGEQPRACAEMRTDDEDRPPRNVHVIDTPPSKPDRSGPVPLE